MKLTTSLLDDLSARAKASPRLRMNLDLRNSAEDGSQRMLNALEPGTILPIHRHTRSTETVVLIRGSVRQNYFNPDGSLRESFIAAAGTSPNTPTADCVGFSVPVGQWTQHRMPRIRNHIHRMQGRRLRAPRAGGCTGVNKVLSLSTLA